MEVKKINNLKNYLNIYWICIDITCSIYIVLNFVCRINAYLQ